MDDEENTLKAGDVCLDCQQRGLEKYLRYFKINLNGDTLLKCESNVCMYPYDMSSTDDDDDDDNKDDNDAENNEIKSISETNSIKFIDDLLQQIKNEAAEQHCNYNESPTVVNSNNENIKNTEHFKEPSNELHADFELSFFDTFENIVNENPTPTANIETESAELLVNICNVGSSGSELPSLTTFDNFTGEPFVREPLNNNASLDNNQRPTISLPSLLDDDYETQQFDKPKINIQSIETIKSNEYNASSLPILTEISKVSAAIKFETKPVAKSNELLLTNAITSRRKMEVTDNKDAPQTSGELLVKNSALSESTRTLDIPKANIMKGSDFLKKLAIIDEKAPKYNIKCKNVRKKSLIKKEQIKKESLSQAADDDKNTHLSINEKAMDNERQAESKPIKEEINFSLEAITEMINAKKIKN